MKASVSLDLPPGELTTGTLTSCAHDLFAQATGQHNQGEALARSFHTVGYHVKASVSLDLPQGEYELTTGTLTSCAHDLFAQATGLHNQGEALFSRLSLRSYV